MLLFKLMCQRCIEHNFVCSCIRVRARPFFDAIIVILLVALFVSPSFRSNWRKRMMKNPIEIRSCPIKTKLKMAGNNHNIFSSKIKMNKCFGLISYIQPYLPMKDYNIASYNFSWIICAVVSQRTCRHMYRYGLQLSGLECLCRL